MNNIHPDDVHPDDNIHPDDVHSGDVSEVQDVFDLFDFWDGRDGLIDAVKVGDLLRCVGLNPTLATVKSLGGTTKTGMCSVCVCVCVVMVLGE